ncbi:ComF family protein [Labrys monachus]|uniref:ComF family protein n=1 Tax=Labrys monachus TaxID=217067 RepID=A0ABU0FQL4_9HYPH|nr:ComF family protein [Labrys monachus]MDQ0396348.1 ComF family protein [Labrys monachus]
MPVWAMSGAARLPPSALSLLARAGSRLIDVVLPPRCLACQASTASHAGLCVACWQKLSLIERPFCERLGIPFVYDHGDGMVCAQAIANPPAYGKARAAARYEGVAIDLVHRLKYGDRVDIAPFMGRLMAQAGRDILAGADMLIPVPLHRLRLWRRRFNQAALLAREVSRRSGVAYEPLLLTRPRRTAHQVGLSRNERARNVQGAFAVPQANRPAIAGRHIVLVDDVLTSGATSEAAARALLRAGAAQVDILVFARVATPIE